MRIRKRLPPLSLPPPPPPPAAPQDLPSSKSREVYHRHDLSPLEDKNPTPLSDPPNQYLPRHIEDENQRQRSDLQLVTDDPPIGVGEEEGVADENRLTEANRRFGYNSSPEPSAEMGHWCEEDREIPLKKRRASFKGKVSKESMMEKEESSRTNVRVRRRRKQKWVESEDGKEEEKVQDGQKREGGSWKMDGLRCSRKNGRGWRCWQQALVGYSMCEHHLEKGRLKRMSNVRSRRKDEEYDEEEDGDDESGCMGAKKRKKIGVVKARSMSSLLGQTVPLPAVTLTTI
ncbi:hypothetical protein L1049_009434 [Liquidambar formosana]|uniref:WRC domain-containing protein n=1 Tax=Liquidambar formosana TaxID=63359 RepID=A0AAP0S574_LIQFO